MKAALFSIVSCLCALACGPIHAQAAGSAKPAPPTNEAQIYSLGMSTGALSGGMLFSTYLGIVHTDNSHRAGLEAKEADGHLIRHLSALSILTKQIAQMRTAFAGDAPFLSFLDKLESVVTMLIEQGTVLRSVIDGSSSRESSRYEILKESSRKHLLDLMNLPDNRKLVP